MENETPALPPTIHPMPMVGDVPGWKWALGQAGLPGTVVLIDFETFFDAEYHMGLGGDALSTIEYVMDSRYEEIAKAVIEVRQPFAPVVPTVWRGDDATIIRHLQREYGSNLEGCTVVAQNLLFDGCILYNKYNIKPPHTIDLLGLARHEEPRDRNDLDSLATRYGLPSKGDTSRFKGLHLSSKWDRTGGGPPKLIHRGMTPDEWAMMVDYVRRDDWLEWHLFTYLMPRLSNPRTEARLMQHTLELFWKPSLKVDTVFAADLASKMKARVEEVVKITGHTAEEISGNKKFGALLDEALTNSGDAVGKYQKMNKKGEAILAIAKTDEALDELKTHKSERVRQLMAARVAIKSWPLHIGRVERIVRQAEATGGLISVPLKYCGAHTGRWSGGERINLQNLSARNIEKLINQIREILLAPEGYALVIVDAAQIEARVCDWIAGESEWLEVWKDKSRDPYCEFAGSMAGRAIRKARKTDPVPIAAYYTKMRGMGKVGVLGCGFGMGADKAVDYAANSYGVEMSMGEALDLVKTYRNGHQKVCKFWRVIEQKFKAAAKYGEPSTMDRGLKFHREDDITVITLPSTRTLKYPGVKVSIINGRDQMWMPDPMTGMKRIFIWGGYLTENVVQAMARDILGEAILKTEEAGYHVALHTHDEEVAVVKKADSAKALTTILDIFGQPPAWCADCPLAAEGHVKERYGK